VSFWLVGFSRTGPARYLSHLDTARAVQRTFARAGVPVAMSQGMRPKPRLSLPLPLPVGAAGRDELAVVEAGEEGPGPAAALPALRAAAPPGLTFTGISVVEEGHPRPQPREAEYVCVVDGDAGALAAAVERFRDEARVVHERVSPKGARTFDLKEFIGDAAAEPVPGGARLRFTVRHRTDGAARPQEFVGLIARWAGADAAMRDLERVRVRWKGSLAATPRAGRSVTP
jgi:radical SAM-linked protein